MKLQHRAVAVTTQADDDLRRVRVVCSSEAVDRYGDIVVQTGLDLTHFRVLKTVLWNHDQDEPIARCIEIDLVGDHIEALVEFPPAGVNPQSDRIYGLIKAGIINAVSIGFGVKAKTPLDKARPKAGALITESELWELSFVSIPANTDAVVVERRAPSRRSTSENKTMTVQPQTKGLYEVAWLANLLRELGWLEDAVEWEADYERDGSDIPARLTAVLAALGQVLVDMTVEEVAEMIRIETGEASTKAASATFARRMADAVDLRLAPPTKFVVEASRVLTAEEAKRIEAAVGAFAADPSLCSIVLPTGVTLRSVDHPTGLVGAGLRAVVDVTRSGKAFSTKNADAIRGFCKSIGEARDGLLAMVDGDAEAEAEVEDAAAKSAAPDPVQARRRRAARALSLVG